VHEALDLEGEAGDCVFAAYAGRVVEVEVGGGGTRGNVSIDHHPLGNGLVSRYLHLRGDSLCVEPGDPVAKGQLIGQLGPGPADPHLHFELRVVLDRSDRQFSGDRNSVAVDPTRLLYRFEADTLPLLQAGAAAVTSIGVQTVAKVRLFRAGTDASEVPFSIPCTSRSASTSGPWPRCSPRPWSWAARSRSSTANRGSSATTGCR
jgi:hypothetical protein